MGYRSVSTDLLIFPIDTAIIRLHIPKSDNNSFDKSWIIMKIGAVNVKPIILL